MPTATLERPAIAAEARPAAFSAAGSVVDLPAFQPLALVSRGPATELWKVCDRRSGLVRALKTATRETNPASRVRERLRLEADVLQRVEGNFVVRLIEVELAGPVPYLLREWYDGTPLAPQISHRARTDYQTALWIARQCLQGLQELLLAGYAHGDVRPEHILVCQNGAIRLLGLGHVERDRIPAVEITDRGAGETGIETAESGRPVDSCSPAVSLSLRNLGHTLYQLLTGEQPSTGVDQSPTIDPRRLRHLAPDIPREIAEFVHSLLALRPERPGPGLTSLIHRLVGLELSLLPESD
ncbi:MAG: protein kinase [Planctomycetes bacterium]|nr:protein kinase [Planctomycetota bacterium]